MYLHEDVKIFKKIIETVAGISGRPIVVIEKDYYVTMILRLLSQQLPNVVFKGGTSLSKGFKVINRFSEDIDITFDEHIGEARRRKLKNEILLGISEELSMPISNWENIRSNRNYNAYSFSYKSVWDTPDDRMLSFVKLETALGSYAYPTQSVSLNSYIGEFLLEQGKKQLAEQFSLNPFDMKLQSIERTYIDKLFALCDYYIQGKSKRYSRHLYDIYKLTEHINIENVILNLYEDVRSQRRKMKNCPSAQKGIVISEIITEFCDNDFYKNDYREITSYFSDDYVAYDTVIKQMRQIAKLLKKCTET